MPKEAREWNQIHSARGGALSEKRPPAHIPVAPLLFSPSVQLGHHRDLSKCSSPSSQRGLAQRWGVASPKHFYRRERNQLVCDLIHTGWCGCRGGGARLSPRSPWRAKALVIPSPPILRLPSANRRERERDRQCSNKGVILEKRLQRDRVETLAGIPQCTRMDHHLKHFSC